MQEPGIDGQRPESGPPTMAFWRRKGTLWKLGLVCFVLGLPMVGWSDGAILSGLGLFLELVAGTCLILIVFAVIDEGHESDEERPGHD
jgi:hypothetical protein